MTVKILQIGAGIRGRHWVQLVKGYPDATCVALVEPDATNLAAARGMAGEGCTFHADLDDALAKRPADAALIVSPDRLHREHAIRCLEAGMHVLVEKPLAPSLEDALAIVDKARQVGKQVIVAEQYRFWPAERTVRKLLDDGAIGKVDHCTVIDRRRQPASGEGPWMAELDYPHLQDIAVHHFDSFRMWFGRPDSIFAKAWRTPWASDYRGRCNTEAIIGFGDVHLQYLGTMRSHRFAFSMFVEGEKGAIWTNRKYVFLRKGGARFFMPVRNVAVPKGDDAPYPNGGTTSILNSLRDAVQKGAVAETAAADNVWSIAMFEAGKRSDAERREVAIGELLRPERLAA